MKKYVEKMLKEGPNRGLVGRHTLILSPEGIRDLSEVGETSSLWASVEKVIRDPNYLLIYNSAVSAYVIPAKAFSSATDLQAFADYADAHRRIL